MKVGIEYCNEKDAFWSCCGGIGYHIASEGGLDKDEKETGKRFAAKFPQGAHKKLLFMLYDSIKNPGDGNAPPILNASSLLIDGIEEELSSHMPIIGAGVTRNPSAY